ncbi:MAG: F0F1 ATP synthase subunit B [Bacteroidales bacterium]|nr:F0F1 ATP synthase subunit B [Bacteroidales bacterium]MDD4576222.1 F0F1 ATP synthase subunit B [Bacteroidales bacterium]
MELIQPGIGLAFWMILSFGILFFILTKFAWKPILKMLKEREDAIDEALNAAEKARAEISTIQSENQALLVLAKEERDVILSEARKIKDNILKEAKEKAQEEGQRIIDSARENIHFEKMQAITDLKNEVAKLSIEIAEKILRDELSNKERSQQIIKDMVKEIKLN